MLSARRIAIIRCSANKRRVFVIGVFLSSLILRPPQICVCFVEDEFATLVPHASHPPSPISPSPPLPSKDENSPLPIQHTTCPNIRILKQKDPVVFRFFRPMRSSAILFPRDGGPPARAGARQPARQTPGARRTVVQRFLRKVTLPLSDFSEYKAGLSAGELPQSLIVLGRRSAGELGDERRVQPHLSLQCQRAGRQGPRHCCQKECCCPRRKETLRPSRRGQQCVYDFMDAMCVVATISWTQCVRQDCAKTVKICVYE